MTAVKESDRLALIGGLRRLRRPHHVSGDCWYSCPKSSEGCCNDACNEDECTCGADAHNALVDDLLSILGPVDDASEATR